MIHRHTVTIPTVNDFSMTYYASNTDEKEAPYTFPPHIHDEIELYIHVEGDASFMVENELYRLMPGDILFSLPNEIHNCILNSESVHKHLCFWFYPECSFLFDKITENTTRGRLVSSDTDRAEILSLCEKLATPPKSEQDLQTFSLALRLVALLDKNLSSNVQHVSRVSLPPVLKEILRDVNEHFAQITTLTYLENKYFISQSTLNRMFKKYLHTTPHQYLETKKLARARTLLKEEKSVFDAYTGAGFSDYSNFAKLFRKRFNLTPKQYLDLH